MSAPTHANNNHAIAEAEAAALEHQDANPPVIQPPSEQNTPKAPALYSPEWYAIQINALEADAQQKYASWQQAIGRLDVLRQLQAMSGAQQQGQG